MGGAGQYDFSSFPGFFGGSGTIEMVGGAVFKFSLSIVFCSGFSWFLNFKLLTLTNCSRMFLGVQHLEEGWDSCLGA